MVDQLGLVRYAYDPESGVLFRSQANYSQALKEQWGPEEAVVAHVGMLRLHYYYGTSKDAHMSTSQGGIPCGVEVELTVKDGALGTDKGEKVFKRYIAIPAGV